MSQDSSRCYRGRTGCVKNFASAKNTRGYSKCTSSGRNTSGCRRSSDRSEEGKMKKKKHSLSPLNMQDELTKRLIVHHKRGITSKPLTLAEIPYVKRKKIKVEPMLALGGFKESRSNRPVKRLTVSSLPAIMTDRDSRTTITSNREFSIMSLMDRKRLSSAPVIPPIRKRASDVESIDKTSITEESDHMELIQRFKDMKEYTFVYLQYAVPRHHALFSPYNFVEVTFDQTDGMDYTTISPEGVTQYSIGEAVFTSLRKWEANYNRYKKIAKMTMFRNYRMWKGFKVWQKGVSWMKYQYAQEYIFRTLFIADIQLGAALIHVMKKRYDLSLFSFYNKKAANNLPFFYYIEDQMIKYETTRDKIMDFRDDTCEYLYSGMEASLWIRGFTTDDRNFARMDDDTGEVRIHQDCMTFTQQANKRKYCERLSRFLTICDYHMISMLREILERTYNDSTEKWTSHYVLRPTDEQLEDDNVRLVLEAKRGSKCPQLPMFAIDLVMTTDGVQPDPSEEIFMSITNQLIELWESYSYGFMRFIADPYFEPFLEPMIMGRRVDRLCGAPTDMHTLLDANAHFLECRESMLQVMEDSFATMRKYLIRFENAGQLYREDLIKDPKTIIDETDVFVLKAYGDRFSNEILFMESLIAKQPIGVFHFNQIPIKDTTVPVVNALMSVLSVTVPLVARNKVILMNEVIQKIMKGLNKIPKTTDDFVDYLQNLESAPDLVDQLDIDMEYVKECYDIIGEHDMSAAEADIDAYYDIGAEIGICRAAVELGLDKRGKLTDDFNDLLGQDISRLIQHVGDIRDAALQPWIIDADTDPDQAKAVLNKLLELQNDCILKSQEYRNYQKLFKVELTKFDFLDEVSTDIRLRILLWDSIESWIDTLSEWYTCNFYDLDPEEMKNFTIKMLKNVNQIEKNFPKDTQLVQSFREDVEFFSNRLNVVSYLRNPDLKARHWLEIERIMSRKFPAGESLTLEKFEEAGCFDWTDELMEVSGKASSEAGLELLLKKVEDAWKEQELSVVNHRNSKDVFILAGLEELQLVIDDSNININTISASRHVGPIKPRVDEWARLLELFSNTMDEWIKCQQSWMYLEAIFGAPDIQRQLPKEAKLFNIVDKSFKDIMRKAYKTPLAMPAVTAPGLLETFQKNNAILEQITKCLEAYLEIKRVGFPRFYFLSNDELLEILAQTRNPFAVQPHLRKCFDAIAKLEFGHKTAEVGDEEPLGSKVMTTDIVAMLSPETERVQLGKGLKARGSVEDWLGKVEESMFLSLKRCMKTSLLDFPTRPRLDWLTRHASQIILIVSQIMWAREVHAILEGANVSHQLKKFEASSLTSLTSCAAMARTDISQLLRKVLCALITVDVHARDTITHMIDANVKSTNDFEWLKMIRYYWLPGPDTVEARMSSASLPYRYEYLGAGGVLVITPLTDRCYLCLMGALQMKLGGAPAGPAGTGKTETTKDLAKALAVQCVVFNCSEGLDYKMMGRFFSGLAQAGAWCCFDEFNRIDIEVLSVIAQQLVTIKNAKVANAERFMFEGRIIKLNPACATFITMNPGYAGRTELPDNLKAMFRPQAMMVPDYALIAEVVLYSEGFESSKPLAQKMVQMYKLCSEQLSIQDHYDFGMRAVKSVLVMAGALKRAAPDQPEDITLICALRDSNLPKFLADDVLLFKGILGDLFPGVELPKQDYGVFQENIEEVMKEHGLQPVPEMVTKIIQLHETMIVRWGVMLVGPTGGGKSTVLKCLGYALARLFEKEEPGQYYRPVVKYTLNPKSVQIDELYGAVNKLSLEWRDGLLGLAVRAACGTDEEIHQWCILDGPVDAMWIENLNTVLDDNKMLCLANSERIKLTPWVHFLFEVMDLAQASPATVSRCGMVYVDPDDLGWLPYVRSWLKRLPEGTFVPELVKIVMDLFENYLTRIMAWVNKMCEFAIHQVDIGKVTLLCCLFEELLKRAGPQGIAVGAPVGDTSKSRCFVTQSFIFAALWSVGGNLLRTSQDALDTYMKDTFDDHLDARIPMGGDLWTLYMNTEERRLELWEKIVPEFIYDTNTPFFDLLVPTSDTARYGHITAILLEARQPVMLTGDTGVGKSVIAKSVLARLSVETECIPAVLNFSAQTSSLNTQEMIELRLEKRKKTVIGAPLGKYAVIFVDDVNMPKLETYGSQPPIELLRQFLDYGGLYDRSKLYWKNILDVVLACACAPPGGGRNPLTPRFTRHFAMFLIPPPQDTSMKVIFRSILDGFLVEFVPVVKALAASLVAAAVEIYQTIEEELLPTPAKSHYVFNLRDLSKCIQGILQADSSIIRDVPHMLRLFYHENLRVYHDRLINDEDKNYFKELLKDVSNRAFGNPIVEDDNAIIIFGDFMVMSMPIEERVYEEIVDIPKLKSVLQDYLDDYSVVTGNDMQIIMFLDAIEHTIRLARLLRAERGNGLLIGMSGMGKQSLTKLGAHLNGYKCAQVELTRGYDDEAFHDDLRHFCWSAGALNIPTVFLFTDTQILQEEFLEDINNLLNSGEVPNLFVADDYEMMIIACRQAALEIGIKDATRDQLYNFFIARVRANLHIVLSMSPVGDAFRRRCRMFPSLVNCCTIDWFVKWPQDALLSVAQNVLKDMGTEEMVDNLSRICVKVHASVEDASENFFKATKRRYYVTPSSYLELLRLYKTLLAKRVDKITMSKERIATGLTKIDETNVIVAAMKIELVDMEPKLAQKSVELGELMVHLEEEQVKVNQVREVVTRDEATAAEIAASTKILAEDAQKDLSTALPALLAAQDALKKLKKKDIDELKAFQNPPILVRFVMESVCLLLNHKIDWPSAKQLLATGNVLQILQDYDKDHIPDKTLVKLKKYIDSKDFNPETLKKVSKVARSMCMWVQAIDIYAKVAKVVEPKRVKLKEAQDKLFKVVTLLRSKQKELADVEAYLQRLQDQFETGLQEQVALEDNMELCASRLNRAGRLTSALADEQRQWKISVTEFNREMEDMLGNILVAAACVAYLGAFTSQYREELVESWSAHCLKLKIPFSKNFSLVAVLGDPYFIRMWNMHGLPRDPVSTDNAIMMTEASRWPLLIDPQEQANRWIRSMEQENDLKITKLSNPNLNRLIESAVRNGLPVLIEEIGEELDPTLAPILNRQTVVVSGRILIRLGDTDVDYDPNFKLYMTSKLSNPHYLPEVCIQVTLVNFTVTPIGLEDQLLSDVVRLERHDLEEQRTQLIMSINEDKQQLSTLEERVLKLLFHSEGCLLDDEELVEALNESKETSAIIEARLIEAETTEEKITNAREKYRTLAARGSILYFVVEQLGDVDPMYQFSLKYFAQIFCTVIKVTEKSSNLEERLSKLMTAEIYSIYVNVARGLFAKHKVLFSFLLSVAVERQLGRVSQRQWNFLLRGPVASQVEPGPKPAAAGLTDAMWLYANHLPTEFPDFSGLPQNVLKVISITLGDFKQEISITGGSRSPSSVNFDSKLRPFDKLLMLKALQEEKLVFAIGSFVRLTLGKQFTESPPVTLANLYADMNSFTPLVFVLSPGSDPLSPLQKFATERKMMDRLESISLGQGQGPVAAALIEKGRSTGMWVYLQNCHLAKSWMPTMEVIVQGLALGLGHTHKDFRLFLSSMPADIFPVSVLQNSVKVTNEPPRGIRANMKLALYDMTPEFFEVHPMGHDWRSMIFGLTLFHGIVLERKKFGPLGWNITYEFSDSDRECALKVLEMFCATNVQVPWDALEYINGEITYGGRVTDEWDQRCLKTILQRFFSPITLQPGYKYSPTGTYYCPNYKTLKEFVTFTDKLPTVETPEIFGMHGNADLVYQINETTAMINTLLEGAPTDSGVSGINTDDVVFETAQDIIDRIIKQVGSRGEPHLSLTKLDSKGRVPSLTTVLTQEVDRFNKLLTALHASLDNLQKAIKGFVVMSEELEGVYAAFINNQVPAVWAEKAYPSLKCLASWVHDLELRLDFIETWYILGLPTSFWVSGFFFPQGFMTGALQTYSRKHDYPIDKLTFDFQVLKTNIEQERVYKAHRDGVKDSPALYGNVKGVQDGIIMHGLFLDAARWDMSRMEISDAYPGEMTPPLPAMHLEPKGEINIGSRYECPMYKTSARAGVLSTTGHSTNFVVKVLLPTSKPQSYWILQGTALLTQTTD